MPIELKPIQNPRSINSAVVDADAGLRAHMRGVYNYMGAGLALTGFIAYFANSSGFYDSIARTPWMMVVMFAPLAMVFAMSFGFQKMSRNVMEIMFWVYAALMGLSLAGIFKVYTGESISRVFFITAVTFAGMSFFGYTTRIDLTRWRSFLMMGLFGIIIASIVNMFFFKSSQLDLGISMIGVIVFVGLTAYKTQMIKALYYAADSRELAGKKIIYGALSLYLSFVNLFLVLLRIFGGRRN